jgi:hypothetical protein
MNDVTYQAWLLDFIRDVIRICDEIYFDIISSHIGQAGALGVMTLHLTPLTQ